MEHLRMKDQRKEEVHFLFVFIWPTWPQLAHLRSVPAVFTPATGEDGEPASSAGPSKWTPFCLSRAMRRSLFRCRRANSFSSLHHIEHQSLYICEGNNTLIDYDGSAPGRRSVSIHSSCVL